MFLVPVSLSMKDQVSVRDVLFVKPITDRHHCQMCCFSSSFDTRRHCSSLNAWSFLSRQTLTRNFYEHFFNWGKKWELELGAGLLFRWNVIFFSLYAWNDMILNSILNVLMFVVFCVNVICSSCKGMETKRAWRFSKMEFYCNIIYNIYSQNIQCIRYMQFVYFIIYLLFFALLICLTNLSNEAKVHHLHCIAGGISNILVS